MLVILGVVIVMGAVFGGFALDDGHLDLSHAEPAEGMELLFLDGMAAPPMLSLSVTRA